jgi:hypothetical protein
MSNRIEPEGLPTDCKICGKPLLVVVIDRVAYCNDDEATYVTSEFVLPIRRSEQTTDLVLLQHTLIREILRLRSLVAKHTVQMQGEI